MSGDYYQLQNQNFLHVTPCHRRKPSFVSLYMYDTLQKTSKKYVRPTRLRIWNVSTYSKERISLTTRCKGEREAETLSLLHLQHFIKCLSATAPPGIVLAKAIIKFEAQLNLLPEVWNLFSTVTQNFYVRWKKLY